MAVVVRFLRYCWRVVGWRAMMLVDDIVLVNMVFVDGLRGEVLLVIKLAGLR